ncbi:MAG: hypothetical protein PGN25_00920 [Methylorubrum populi]
MQRSREEAEELIRALEMVWGEQSNLAKTYQAEAADLWRLHAAHEKLIAELRSEVKNLRALLEASTSKDSNTSLP